MLQNGKFIKEKPVRIGMYYEKPVIRHVSDDENFMQQVYLGGKPDSIRKELGVATWLIIIYSVFAFLVAVIGAV